MALIQDSSHKSIQDTAVTFLRRNMIMVTKVSKGLSPDNPLSRGFIIIGWPPKKSRGWKSTDEKQPDEKELNTQSEKAKDASTP